MLYKMLMIDWISKALWKWVTSIGVKNDLLTNEVVEHLAKLPFLLSFFVTSKRTLCMWDWVTFMLSIQTQIDLGSLSHTGQQYVLIAEICMAFDWPHGYKAESLLRSVILTMKTFSGQLSNRSKNLECYFTRTKRHFWSRTACVSVTLKIHSFPKFLATVSR